jgi:glycosyltransferase involved in cell wall biosynthesis
VKVSIVIPCYNERGTIAQVLERVLALPLDKEVLVVDDGSKDGSSEVLAGFAGRPGLRVLTQSPNQGKGAALRRGFLEAKGEVVVVQDADLELDPEDLVRVVEPVSSGKARVSYGTRFAAGAPKRLTLGYAANRFLTGLTNLLYGSSITDMETCFKCFESGVLKRFVIESDRFDFEPEITAKVLRLGCAIFEVPIIYRPRTHAQGKKIGWRDGLKAIAVLLRYRFASMERIAR